MNQISIVAKSSLGIYSLQKEDISRKKMKIFERVLLKSLFDVVISDNPFTITLISKTSFLGYVNPIALIQNIEDSLKLRGCVLGVDYDVFLDK